MPRLLPTRTLTRTKVCILLILGVGSVLIFSYLAQIHNFMVDKNSRYGTALAFAKERPSPQSAVLTKTEKVENTSSAPLRSPRYDSSGTLTNRTALYPPPPPPPKKDWKDIKVEKYMPLVDSVHSNIVSSKFRFVIKVLSLNDYSSLVRCLSSLSNAKYTGDTVDIHIYIDHFEAKESLGSEKRSRLLLVEEPKENAPKEKLSKENAPKEKAPKDNVPKEKAPKENAPEENSNLQRHQKAPSKSAGEDSRREHDRISSLPDRIASSNESVDWNDWELVDQKLEDARMVLNYSETFQWKHGRKFIHYSTTTTGVQSQWLDAWWPSSDDEFALFVEDDAEVSPLYYRYARALIATYYYQPTHFDSSIYGIALQRAQIVPGKLGRPVKVSKRTRLFMYQMVGTWGQIFFPKPWKEFRLWYDSRKNHDAKPVIDGMVTTDWYERHGEAIFTPWFVKFAYNRGYFNLYTNFLKERVLSVTHREFRGKSKKHAGCDSVLLWKNGTYDIDLWHMAATSHIKRYDYCFREVKVGRFATSLSEASAVLGSVSDIASQDGKEVLMVSTFGVPGILVRNWLCRVRNLNISNYVVIGEDRELLEDLARRGHSAIMVENKRNSTWRIEKEVKTIAETLNLGYNVWFTRADTIWIGNPLERIENNGVDIVGLEENFSLNLFFVRSTNVTIRFWGSSRKEFSKAGVNVSEADIWEKARRKILEGCEKETQGQIRKLENVEFIEDEKLPQLSRADMSEDSRMTRILVLSGWNSSSQEQLKAKAEQLSLWDLDDDYACTKLTC